MTSAALLAAWAGALMLAFAAAVLCTLWLNCLDRGFARRQRIEAYQRARIRRALRITDRSGPYRPR